MSSPTALSPAYRASAIKALASGGELDVLVVGGGVTGAGCALDPVTRGLSTRLVEKRDIPSGPYRRFLTANITRNEAPAEPATPAPAPAPTT